MIDEKFEILFEEFERIGKAKTYQSHKTLVDLNEVANKIFVVKKGGAVLYHINPNSGNERAINFFIPDYHPIATVSESFAYGTPSKYRWATFTNSQLIEVPKTSIMDLRNDPVLGEVYVNYGVMTLLDKNELRAMLLGLSSEEMLHHLHTELPQIIRQVPSKYIANFLGITPQWLSKLKHNL